MNPITAYIKAHPESVVWSPERGWHDNERTEMGKLVEIANPAAIAWHWESDGVEHAITWIRGTSRLSFGVKSAMTGQWHDTSIVSPERFGFDGTLAGARKAAQNFVEGMEL